MPDRRVVYKTPLQRFSEIALVLLTTLAAAALWRNLLPGISVSTAIIGSLIVGFSIVPPAGAALARRFGGTMMTRDERTRRYLSELGPIGLVGRPGALPAYGGPARRGRGRSIRR